MAKKKEETSAAEGAPVEGAEAAPPKKKKKLILILAIAVPLLLGGIAAALFFTGVIGGKKDPYAGLPPECVPKDAHADDDKKSDAKKDEHAKDEKKDEKKDDHAKDNKTDDKKSEHADGEDYMSKLTPDEQKACEKAKKKMEKDAKKKEGGEEKKEEGGHGGGDGKEGGSASASNFFDLPDMVVNLDSGSKRQVFLKLSVSLELDDPGDKKALEEVMPRIVDQFQVYLRELRVEDLRGSAGVYRLRQELLARVQPAVAPVEIKDVLFREILVQ